MRKLFCMVVGMIAFGFLSSISAKEEIQPFLDDDVVEQTDVYAIPLDKSADTDESELAKLKKMEKKSEKPQQKTQDQKENLK